MFCQPGSVLPSEVLSGTHSDGKLNYWSWGKSSTGQCYETTFHILNMSKQHWTHTTRFPIERRYHFTHSAEQLYVYVYKRSPPLFCAAVNYNTTRAIDIIDSYSSQPSKQKHHRRVFSCLARDFCHSTTAHNYIIQFLGFSLAVQNWREFFLSGNFHLWLNSAGFFSRRSWNEREFFLSAIVAIFVAQWRINLNYQFK